MLKRVVVSGCSGGGKSTLLAELARLGHGVVEEPGRRIIAEERAAGGKALPWIDPIAFLERAIQMSASDLALYANPQRWVFFDRGLVDAMSAMSQLTGEPLPSRLEAGQSYHHKVFLTPPWPEIYVNDADRQHPYSEAVLEYERLLVAYPSLGYEVVVLSKTSVESRAECILQALAD